MSEILVEKKRVNTGESKSLKQTVKEGAAQLFDTEQPGVGSTGGRHIVVIGAGPAGVRLVENILEIDPLAKITLMGNEPYVPYNRVRLTGVLSRDVKRDTINYDLPNPKKYSGFSYMVASVTAINRAAKTVRDSLDREIAYDNLVLAVGARAHVPNIEGNHLKGVYTFRNLKDTDALYARLASAKKIVVVGGGLLGLEAAKALTQANTEVIVVQQNELLMNRQLDARSSKMLVKKMESLGIDVQLGDRVSRIMGDIRVDGVIKRDGRRIDCDTVLFCTGIRPNTRLAIDSGLAFNTGIRVDDTLCTSDPNIYAIGECCEHDNVTFGLVGPGFEQAAVLANRLTGGDARYAGSLSVARLKVVGQSLASMGDISEDQLGLRISYLTYKDKKNHCYRKLVLKKNILIGALSYGDWDEVPRLQEAIQQDRRIPIWNRLSFIFTGNLWSSSATTDIKQWPAGAIVCQCNGISVQSLLLAVDGGADSLDRLQACTGAGTVCGSCKPLLAELTGDDAPQTKEKAWVPVLVFSLLTCLIALGIAAVPGRPVADSVAGIGFFESMWNDKFNKQVTGFSLLGLTVVGLVMSLRKRLRWFSWGDFPWWRLVHVALGLGCIALLVLHTGFHLGANFNRLLIVDFLAVIIFGAVTGLVVSMSHSLSLVNAKRLREFWGWAHILVTWPLPILLGIHILSVYYF